MKGERIPDYKGIHLENILSITPGIVQVAGLNAEHITELSLDGVTVQGIKPDQVRARYASFTLGAKGANFSFNGVGVTNSGEAAAKAKTTFGCDGKFVPYQD